ncbi:HPSE [Mytilus edulis]|uniref:HPSE n=1 Tax=Mytilus edulis TaxID=6550 RepID=A0A8S3S5I9_MYTED|nr:HPSE [Mytilus edulis]
MAFGWKLFLLLSFLNALIEAIDLKIATDRAVQIVSDKYLSIAIDTGIIRHNWERLNFSSIKVESLARALSPCYLRVGGSEADFMKFSPDTHNVRFYNQSDLYMSDYYDNKFVNFTMFSNQFDELNNFVTKVGWSLIFDLNSLLREDGQWLPDNAKLLMDYTSKKGYKITGWELGNEPNSYKHHIGYSISGSQRAKDYSKLHSLLNQYPQWRNSVIIGPSTTQLSKTSAEKYFTEFLQTGGPDIVTNPTFHQYYINGREATIDQFMDIDILNSLIPEINKGNKIAKHPPYGKTWLGETGSAYGGGAPGLSNTYVAGFMWLDKLGISAVGGLDVLIRQTFYGGHYSIIDDETSDPLPPAAQNNQPNNRGGAAYMAAPRQQQAVPKWNRAGEGPRGPAANPIQQAEENRQKGADAAERARIVGDFIQRKQEAEANRRRGNAELFGGAAPYESPRNVPPSPSPMRDDGRPSSADSRRREEEEYLERLKKIRQANYNERRNDKNNEAEVRKKKIEALRQQADDKARQLKEQLERQRREMVQKEERMRNHQMLCTVGANNGDKCCNETLGKAGGRALGGILSKIHNFKDVAFKTFETFFELCVDYWADVKILAVTSRSCLGLHRFAPVVSLNSEIGWIRRWISMVRRWNTLVKIDMIDLDLR